MISLSSRQRDSYRDYRDAADTDGIALFDLIWSLPPGCDVLKPVSDNRKPPKQEQLRKSGDRIADTERTGMVKAN